MQGISLPRRVQEMYFFCFHSCTEKLQPGTGSCHSQYKHIKHTAARRLDRPSRQKMEELTTAPRGRVAMPERRLAL